MEKATPLKNQGVKDDFPFTPRNERKTAHPLDKGKDIAYGERPWGMEGGGRGDEISRRWPNDRPPSHAHEYEQKSKKNLALSIK